jgi:hypothetical protein
MLGALWVEHPILLTKIAHHNGMAFLTIDDTSCDAFVHTSSATIAQVLVNSDKALFRLLNGLFGASRLARGVVTMLAEADLDIKL